MLDVKSTTVRLGEKDYTIRQASFRRAKPWKQRLLTEIKPLFEQVASAQDMQFDTPADLLKLIPVAESLFVDGIEQIADLLITYAPELEEDKDYIEDNATDQQIFGAFQEVLQLADFFGVVGLMNQRLGRTRMRTSSNSPSPNGDSP